MSRLWPMKSVLAVSFSPSLLEPTPAFLCKRHPYNIHHSEKPFLLYNHSFGQVVRKKKSSLPEKMLKKE